MDINLEKYTEDLLKGYCDKKPATKNKFIKNIKVIKAFSTNVLENHGAESMKECKIRDTDPLINITNPIAKTKEDYENILGNIIEAECKLIDVHSSDKLPTDLLKLINFCNIRILEFNKNPIKSVETCNFKIKVYNKQHDILFKESFFFPLSLFIEMQLRKAGTSLFLTHVTWVGYSTRKYQRMSSSERIWTEKRDTHGILRKLSIFPIIILCRIHTGNY